LSLENLILFFEVQKKNLIKEMDIEELKMGLVKELLKRSLER